MAISPGGKLIDPKGIDHPSHYNQGKFEVIDVIEDWKLGFNIGNAVKYLGRGEHKADAIKDYEKAIWYINRQIQLLKSQIPPETPRPRGTP